ncbi:TPA: hypothetical protein DEF17_09260 [bacterium]|nr:hypothetical protein [bacterium]
MCDRHNESSGSNALLSFLLGMGIGGVLGILYAPSSGEEMRRRLKYYAEETADKVVKKTQDIREEADATVKKVSNEFKAGKEKIKAALDAGKNAFKCDKNEEEEL